MDARKLYTLASLMCVTFFLVACAGPNARPTPGAQIGIKPFPRPDFSLPELRPVTIFAYHCEIWVVIENIGGPLSEEAYSDPRAIVQIDYADGSDSRVFQINEVDPDRILGQPRGAFRTLGFNTGPFQPGLTGALVTIDAAHVIRERVLNDRNNDISIYSTECRP